MKKRIISLILTSIMLLSMTSCSKKEKKIAYQEGMTLEEYIDKVELPKNLTISVDPMTVEERETAKVYENVDLKNFDDELLKKYLLQNPVTAEEIYDLGPQYVSETDTQIEYLNVSDGGEAYYGERGQSIDGGFEYLRSSGKSDYPAWLLMSSEYPELYMHATFEDNFIRGIYDQASKNLGFVSREEIANQAVSLFQNVGVPEVEAYEVVAYNFDTIQLQYNFQKSLYTGVNLLAPQKSDECYQVLCRQLIDGIPIDTYETRMEEDCPWAFVQMSLQYTQTGLVKSTVCNLVEQPNSDDGVEEKILSAASILNLVKNYYGKGILLESYEIESLELVYKLYWAENDKSVSLIPYWLVRVAFPLNTSAITNSGEEIDGEIKGYDHLYFHAINGEYLDVSPSAKSIE